MKIKKILAVILCAVMLISATGCGAAEDTGTAEAADDKETEAIATTTAAEAETTATTLAETTVLTTTAETEPPVTEPTTTASITTADNSNDTRSTKQKLDDIIAANPDVEIGYALYNADTNEYLFHFNDEMEINVSGEVSIYWLYLILERDDLDSDFVIGPFIDTLDDGAYVKITYEDSYVYDSYIGGAVELKAEDLINYYFYDGDEAAKWSLERNSPLTYGGAVVVADNRVEIMERDSLKKSSIPEYLAKWININKFLNEDSEDSEFLRDLLANTDRDSFFYEGTGIVSVHAGDQINTEYYDTGVVTVNDVDYIYVIYTKNADSADIVRDISRYFYDEVK
ncbi:MAG: hypothetical protein LBL87_07115 [Ruminococcus sp.]|nr:hypothetical protein [Ruminococcus sp.]